VARILSRNFVRGTVDGGSAFRKIVDVPIFRIEILPLLIRFGESFSQSLQQFYGLPSPVKGFDNFSPVSFPARQSGRMSITLLQALVNTRGIQSSRQYTVRIFVTHVIFYPTFDSSYQGFPGVCSRRQPAGYNIKEILSGIPYWSLGFNIIVPQTRGNWVRMVTLTKYLLVQILLVRFSTIEGICGPSTFVNTACDEREVRFRYAILSSWNGVRAIRLL
jgi:hypothetical protein